MISKKIYIGLTFIMLLNLSDAFAQYEFSVGPRMGLLYSTYRLNYPSLEYEMRPGFTGGIYARYTRNNMFFIEPGLQLSSKGTIQLAVDSFPRAEYVATYIDIPILFGIQPVPEFFQIKAGLQFSNIVSAYARSQGQNEIFKDFYNSWDISAIMEIAYEFNFGLNVGLRFANGITDLRRESNVIPNSAFNDEIRSFNMQLLVGYNLPIITRRY